eukprot:8431595-Pyramimonas_sp.AAC.1
MTTTTAFREKERVPRARTRANTTGQRPTLAVARDTDHVRPSGPRIRREARHLRIRDFRLRHRGDTFRTRSESRQCPGDQVAAGSTERQ